MIDRSATARALAKAIAHKQAGNHDQAAEWAAELVRLLECAHILQPGVQLPVQLVRVR